MLIGGNDYRQFVVRRVGNEALIEDITAVCRRMWHDHILPGVPPAVTGEPDRVVELYGRLHPDRSGVLNLAEDAELSVAVMNDLLDYEENRITERQAEVRKKAAKARLVGHLGDAEIAARNGEMVFSYEASPRRSADLDGLSERHPDVYADVVSEKPSRRLNIAKTHRLTIPKEEVTDGSA